MRRLSNESPGSTTELSIFRGGPAYPLSLSLSLLFIVHVKSLYTETRDWPRERRRRKKPGEDHRRLAKGKKMTVVNLNRAIVGKGWRKARGFSKEITLSGRKEEIGSRRYREVCREGKWTRPVVPRTIPSRRSKANDAITSPAPTRSLCIVIRDAITR